MKNKYKHGFKVPEGYFDSFEAHLFQKLEEEKLPENTGFKVPPGYFNTLEERIHTAVKKSYHTPKVISIFSKKTAYFAAAVAAIAVIILTTTVFNTNNDTAWKNIPYAAINTYIEEGKIEVNALDVIALLEDEEVATMEWENNLITEEDLEEYILETVEDPQLINE